MYEVVRKKISRGQAGRVGGRFILAWLSLYCNKKYYRHFSPHPSNKFKTGDFEKLKSHRKSFIISFHFSEALLKNVFQSAETPRY